MPIVGIIAEYNPLHNGHLYHLTTAKKQCRADGVVCVMSGCFSQRGEPMVLNKWARTATALKAGADIVLELPVAFATSSANVFAFGGIAVLNATGVVTHLSFGSESGNLNLLMELARILEDEPESLTKILKDKLAEGHSYPKARALALEYYLKFNKIFSETDTQTVTAHFANPNNILGIEYLRAMIRTNSRLIPHTVQRLGAGYHSRDINQDLGIASATAVRHLLSLKGEKRDTGDTDKVIPDFTRQILAREMSEGRGPLFFEMLSPLIIPWLRRSSAFNLAAINDVAEGLEHRLLEQSKKSGSLHELVAGVKTKRYTQTRIQRILLHFLLGFVKEQAAFLQKAGPQYLRVLGFSKRGQEILKEIRLHSSLPVIMRPAAALKEFQENRGLQQMLNLDILATDIYTFLYPNPEFRRAGQDFTTQVVRL